MRLDVADRLAVTWAALDERPRSAEDVHRVVRAIGNGGAAYLQRRHELASRLIPVAAACTVGHVRAALAVHVRMGQVVKVDRAPALYRRIDESALQLRRLREALVAADESGMPVLTIPRPLPGLTALQVGETWVIDAGGLRRWLEEHFPSEAA